MNQSKISKIAKHLCKLWSLHGLPIFTLKNGKFVNKPTKSYIFSLLFVAVVVAIYTRIKKFDNRVYSYITTIQFFSIFLLNTGFIICSHRKRKKIEKIFANLLHAETMVHRFSGDKFPSSKIGRNLLIYIIFQFMLTLVQFVSVTSTLSRDNLSLYFEILCHQCLLTYSFNFNIMIFFFLFSLREIGKHFVGAIQAKMSHKVLDREFRQVMEISTLLHNVANDVHQTFQLVLLLKIFKDFILAVSSAYHSAFTMANLTTVLSYLRNITEVGVFLFATLMSNFGMVYYFDEISKQDVNLMEIMDEILISFKDDLIVSYKSVELFDLRLKNRNSTFYVCGLFPLNCTFIYTMIAGMASYMIYLVQFTQVQQKDSTVSNN
ncbi:gustatory receptor 174 [Tribolium castaneum]|uniref:Gustatory receptor n=2 Tax=Tribolium castaneum TaxID=7070 RepID=B8PUP4_TRICA|nr:gustatory receptor [Tribolium castaneum]EEZ99398.1 gustatory receptor 174 [Tribolium castaneum]